MAKYVICSETRSKSHDYKIFRSALLTMQAQQLQTCVWLAAVNGSASDVRDVLQNTLHPDDPLAVIRLPDNSFGSDWAIRLSQEGGAHWLANHYG